MSGILGQAAPDADADVPVYTVGAGKLATVNINVVNRGSTLALVRFALSEADAPTDAEFIEYDYELPPKGVLERTGFMLQAGRRVVVRASTADCSFTVQGPERAV